jgi:hypothetical protein
LGGGDRKIMSSRLDLGKLVRHCLKKAKYKQKGQIIAKVVNYLPRKDEVMGSISQYHKKQNTQ